MSEVKLNPTTTAIADSLNGKFELVGNELKLVDEKAAYIAAMPIMKDENLTEAGAEATHKYDAAYRPGFILAAGEAAIEAFVSNPELGYVQANTMVGTSNVDVLVKDSAEVKKGIKPDSPVETVRGHSTVTIKTKSPTEVKKVRDWLAQTAGVKLSK